LKSVFLKNVTTLITGNALALVIPVILYPVLSRIFTEQDYALFGLYIGVFSFLEIASAGRYDFAIVIPQEDKDAINIAAGGLFISLGYALIVLVLVILFNDALAQQLNNAALANWLYFLPLSLIFISISKLCNGWLVRIKRFKAASINKASHKIGEVTAQLGFGLTSGNGLILGDLTGRLLNAGFSIYQSVGSGLDRKLVEKSIVIENLKKYSDLPKYNVLPSVLNTLGGMMPVFVISSNYSPDISGSFNFSRLLLSVPFALISAAISQVVMQLVSERRHKGEKISNELFSLAAKLFVVASLCIIPLYFTGPTLFSFVFGQKWETAGAFTGILIFSYAVTFVVSPFSILLVVLQKVKWLSFWQIFYFILASCLWLFNGLEINDFLGLLVAMDLIAYTIYGILIYKAVVNYQANLAQTLS
jgi:O-antigen/teichoic acid export membrane protein